MQEISVERLRLFADLAVEALGAAREELDALNVYPVPDADTGTNLFLTLEAARDELVRALEAGTDDLAVELSEALLAYARGALLGARGNSGVILSQLVGALFRHFAAALLAPPEGETEEGRGPTPTAVLAEGMVAAADAAWAAVGAPVEGTILSVARSAADATVVAASQGVSFGAALHAAAEAAREASDRTPEQLPVLREAGVVDAGGRGLCVLLDAADQAATGRRDPRPYAASQRIPVPLPADDLTPDGPGYEVMYLLDAPDEQVPALRTRLGDVGESLVVVGGDGLWNVHVHTDDVGAAVEAGIAAGVPRRIRVTHFAEQVDRARERGRARQARGRRAVVVVAVGPGLAEVFAEAGAAVVEAPPGRRTASADVLAAIEGCGAEQVIVLPNDKDTIVACEAAAREAGERDIGVVVIPTQAQVQGIAALAVHEPGRPLEADVVAMTSAARHTRHGAVTVADRQAITTVGPCEPGQVLGAVEGDFVAIGADLVEVATDLLDRLLAYGGELVTLVAGEGAQHDEVLEQVATHLERTHPGVDVVRYRGGQERYPLLFGVE